ncbi:hypothetical protein K3495_g8490 [Podosphaera aphanis]|nr:hypothetical protein K3495_g8490 [Podosphaera aphanis]
MRHFIPVTSLDVDELTISFTSRIYSLHSCPENIVSDRGTQFVSEFWRQLSSHLGIALRPSSAFHPEIDGQTERINAGVEIYLRAFMNFHQDDWVDWLPLAEFAANNVVSETTVVSPFFANYGYNPKIGIEPSSPCHPNATSTRRRKFYRANAIATRFSRILERLRALAKLSQERYEENENLHRKSSPRYQVGDMVYVDTRNMKTNRSTKKGDDKWDAPNKVLEVYPRACKLELPRKFRIYPVFHNNLIELKSNSKGLKGQDKINESERPTRGRILEREDGIEEPVERYEVVDLLDNYIHPELASQYLIKWKHQKPSW